MQKGLEERLFGVKDWIDKSLPERIELLCKRAEDVDNMRVCGAVLLNVSNEIEKLLGCSVLEAWQLVQWASQLTDTCEEEWNEGRL